MSTLSPLTNKSGRRSCLCCSSNRDVPTSNLQSKNLTCNGRYPLPLRNRVHEDDASQYTLSQSPSVRMQGSFPLLSPSPTPKNFLRKNKLTLVSLARRPLHDVSATGVILGLEARIAQPEKGNTETSLDLDAARDAISHKNRRNQPSRRDSTMSSQLQLSETLASFEIQRHGDILASLKAARIQKLTLSSHIEKQTERNEILNAGLENERSRRKIAELELKRLREITLSEHSHLPSDHDTALQNKVPSLMLKYDDDDDSMLLAELRITQEKLREKGKVCPADGGSSPELFTSLAPVTSESGQTSSIIDHAFQGLRSELLSTRYELQLTKDRLAASDGRCIALVERICSLQRNITTCVDESAKALDVERELRSEIEGRIRGLSVMNEDLRTRLVRQTNEEAVVESWKRAFVDQRLAEMRVDAAESCCMENIRKETEDSTLNRSLRRRIASLREDVIEFKKREVEFQVLQREFVTDFHLKSVAVQRIAQRQIKRANQRHRDNAGKGVDSERTGFVASTESVSKRPVKATVPAASKNRVSVILGITLARASRMLSYITAESSIFVDTTNMLDVYGDILV